MRKRGKGRTIRKLPDGTAERRDASRLFRPTTLCLSCVCVTTLNSLDVSTDKMLASRKHQRCRAIRTMASRLPRGEKGLSFVLFLTFYIRLLGFGVLVFVGLGFGVS